MSLTTRPSSDVAPRRGRALVRAMGALLALVGLVLVVPVLLVRLGAALPVDPVLLTPGLLTRPDEGGLLLLLLLAVAWGAWAVMVASIAMEAGAVLRRVPAPRVPGLSGPQRVAAALVGALVVGLAPAASGASWAHPGPTVTAQVDLISAVTRVVADGPPIASLQQDPGLSTGAAAGGSGATGSRVGTTAGLVPDGSAPATPAVGPVITTQRHDTLWLLAETHLGSGQRYAEILSLNVGVAQPDGRSLGEDGRVYPGWQLVLPADAAVDVPRAETRIVEPGDTLWEIAGAELGDPTRYPEVFRANRGDLQADGRRLADPDLILPGWVLEIPGTEAEGRDPAGRGAAEAAPVDPAEPEEAAADPAEADPAEADPAEADPAEADPADSAERTGPRAAELPAVDRSVDVDQEPAPSPASVLPPVDRGVEDPAEEPATEPQPASEKSDPDRWEETDLPAVDRAAGPVPEAAVLVPAGGMVAVLLLVGLARELSRRRRQFQRYRRPGERMASPGPAARDVERLARAAAEEPGPDLLERSLIQLASEARSGGRELPDVRVVRLSEDSVELGLAVPATPIAPFVAVDSRRWVLDRALLDADRLDGDSPMPGLVTIGVAGDQSVLVDMAALGTLQVAGAAEAVPGVVRAMASELALGPAREATARTLCLADDALSAAIAAAVEAGDLTLDRDARRVVASLEAVIRRGARAGSPESADPLELVLADRPLTVSVPRRSGAALITTADVADPGGTLVLRGDGTAVLEPDGVELVPQALAPAATAALADLLATTALPDDPADGEAVAPPLTQPPVATRTPDPLPAPTTSGPATSGPATSAAAVPVQLRTAPREATLAAPTHGAATPAVRPHGAATPAAPPDPGLADNAPRIRLLGELVVEGAQGRAESTRIGRLAETAAFALLNPGSRPSALQSALWPGRRSNPQTCRQMISRTRTWLGRTESGDPYLVPFDETGGRLRLRDEVGSDWAQFQELARDGLADPADVESLEAALALVRGRPFGSVASRELPWADEHINTMISLIVDVAYELAVRHEARGDWTAARAAALRGLRTQCESEVLESVLTRVGRRA